MKIEGYDLPSTFRFPSQRDFAKYTTGALSSIGFDTEFSRTMFTVPMQTHVNTMIVAVESAAGEQIDRLASKLSSDHWVKSIGGKPTMEVIGAVTSLVYNLVSGNVATSVQAGIQLATAVATSLAGSISSMVDVIPVVGAMITAVVDTIFLYDSFGWGSEEERSRAIHVAQAEAHVALTERCPRRVPQPIATSTQGATPADMFRTVFLAAQLGRPLPPTLASMYVLLCGSETQGVGFTRRDYDLFLNKARKEHGDVGIDTAVQRRMWALVKGIMFSTKDPSLDAPLFVNGDQGRSSYALLQDIVHRQYKAGRWNPGYAASLSRALGNQFGVAWRTAGPIGTSASGWTGCGQGDYMRLDGGLFRAQRVWMAGLEENFCDPGSRPTGSSDCTWLPLATPAAIAKLARRRQKVGIKAILGFRPSQVVELENAVAGAADREEEAVARAQAKSALAAIAGIGLGAAAIVGASKLLVSP